MMPMLPMDEVKSNVSGQRYRRTNFDDDETSPGTPPGLYDPAVTFKVENVWKKRSVLEKLLSFLLILCIFVLLILIIMLSSSTTKMASLKNKEANLCLTKACITAASTIINAMDTESDPCQDFFQFSCGGWVKSHPIPAGLPRWGTFNEIGRKNQVIMRNVLDQTTKGFKIEAHEKARLYYLSCMDKNQIMEKLEAKPLLDFIDKLGGWSISKTKLKFNIDNFNKNKFQELLEQLFISHVSPFFNFWLAEDEKNSSRHIFQISQGGLQLERDQLINGTESKSLDDQTLEAYINYLTEISVLMGGNYNTSRTLIEKVVILQQNIAKFTQPEEERRNDLELYHLYSIEKLQNEFPFIDWQQFINYQLKWLNLTERVTKTEPIVMLAPRFFSNLTVLIQKMLNSPEEKLTLHNYMMWSIVQPLSSALSKKFRDARKKFVDALYGSQGNDERWRHCISDTGMNVGFALGAIFVEKAFAGQSRNDARIMINNIRQSFIDNLHSINWMDEPTKKLAIDKAKAVHEMIGYPEFILDEKELNKRYSNLHVTSDEYFENTIRSTIFSIRRQLEKLRKKPNREEWNMTPPTVNAYYQPTKNEIVFPAGILQAPFYDKDFPKSLNYGGIGVVMGHELTHGFDDQGREYDKNGILRDWWPQKVTDQFQIKAECMIKQYNQYGSNGMKIRGKQTLGENIADNGGMKSAYKAYETWLMKHNDRNLPGMNFTNQQLFFISFAQVWCSSQTEKAVQMSILADPHSLDRFRVLGTLSNSNEFSESFKCKKGSPMNPENKCIVW